MEVNFRRISAAVLFNEYMRDIEKQYVNILKRINLQLPQYRELEAALVREISLRVKQHAKK